MSRVDDALHQPDLDMNDLSRMSLDTLLKIAHRVNVVDSYRTTDWVVFLSVDGRELVFNHAHARYFLQGLIYGVAMKNRGRKSEAELRQSWIETDESPQRIVLG